MTRVNRSFKQNASAGAPLKTSKTILRRIEMSETKTNVVGEELTLEQWLQIRKEEGLRNDPESAEVTWSYAPVLDPSRVYQLLPEEECVGRVDFARSPGSDIWVCFYDLPDGTREKLWKTALSAAAS